MRAYSAEPERSRRLLETVMGATPLGDGGWELRGERRGGTIHYDSPPGRRATRAPGPCTTSPGARRWPSTRAGTSACNEAGVRATPIIDRHYFHSIYFREPSGVLFEIADDGPGFTVDVPLEELGSKVILPPFLEDRREQIEEILTPLPDPRANWPAESRG